MKSINRRQFLKGSISAATTFTLLSQGKNFAANDKVIIGVMGLGGRGTYLAEKFAQRPDAEVAYLCDVNPRCFARAREAVEEVQQRKPKLVKDFREILDDPDVDALVNATPDHWHGLGTIMACQAGKDVYVEKPLCHNIWEGRKMVEAARKYKRVVQVGMQSRSGKDFKKAVEYIRAGRLGDIYIVRVFNMMGFPSRPKGPERPVPEGLNYDMWCGPAPKVPYSTPNCWWTERWDFGCGGIAADAVHQVDLARFMIDKPYPDTVCHTGGVNFFKDGREIPDTQLVTYEYGKLTLIFEAALWTGYMKKTPWSVRDSDQFPNWPFSSTKIELLGTKGFMFYGRHGGGWQAYDAKGELVHSEYGRHATDEHLDNFIDCIRTRNKPIADVEEGHLSTLLCHLANISYRVGNLKLKFDPKTETITNIQEANKYLRRKGRAPWIIPDEV